MSAYDPKRTFIELCGYAIDFDTLEVSNLCLHEAEELDYSPFFMGDVAYEGDGDALYWPPPEAPRHRQRRLQRDGNGKDLGPQRPLNCRPGTKQGLSRPARPPRRRR